MKGAWAWTTTRFKGMTELFGGVGQKCWSSCTHGLDWSREFAPLKQSLPCYSS